MVRNVLSWLPRFWTNWITILGATVSTVSASTIVLMLAAGLVSSNTNPYLVGFALLVLPAFLVCGLLLIPLGFWYERRRKPREPGAIQLALQRMFENRKARWTVIVFFALTAANIGIIGSVGMSTMAYMDTPEFCGTVCHTVMQPEYTAYQRSPHSRVACVDCHIGPGASWAVKAKLDGLRQVWGVITDDFRRPIPTPVHDLRPARDTCEQCHWPAKFHGNRVALFTRRDSDKSNTPSATALLLNIGGEDPKSGRFRGIHWHVSPEIEIRYEALDERREVIGKVTRVENGQVVAEFESPTEGEVKETRVMDCVDCHNRPTHIFDHSPEAAIDDAFAHGRLDPNQPWLRAMAVQVLGRDDIPREQAGATLRAALEAAYAEHHPNAEISAAQIAASAEVLTELYLRNIFPEMKVGWDTYASHLGHRGEDSDKRGCFRCHDEEHETADGRVLSQDCDQCHQILNQDEPLEDLSYELRGLLGL